MAVSQIMATHINTGSNIRAKENNTPNRDKASKCPHCGCRIFFRLIDRTIPPMERNRKEKPTNNANAIMLIKGLTQSKIPKIKLMIPNANDQPH